MQNFSCTCKISSQQYLEWFLKFCLTILRNPINQTWFISRWLSDFGICFHLSLFHSYTHKHFKGPRPCIHMHLVYNCQHKQQIHYLSPSLRRVEKRVSIEGYRPSCDRKTEDSSNKCYEQIFTMWTFSSYAA